MSDGEISNEVVRCSTMSAVPIQLDAKVLGEVGLSSRSTVTVRGDHTTAGKLLAGVLKDHQLTCVERDGVLVVVIDPSHGTGHTWLVPQMCAASVAAGADGLIIEVHPDPERALSDGGQSLNCEQFADTMRTCRKVAEALGKTLGSGR